jgi:WD40 repeat protein
LVLKGGFWDGRIEINSIEPDSKENNISSIIFPGYDKPILCLEMSKDEKLLLCGAKDGSIFAFEVNGKMLTFKDTIDSHTDEITSISINDTLNMFASASMDGYIMIYILPSMKLVRAIHISSLKQKIKNHINENNIINNANEIIKNQNDKKNEFDNEFFEEYKEQDCLYADNIFLSSSPLPCIAIFISKRRIFRSYTINGEFINEIEETEKSSKINSPIIYKNLYFQEFLVYGTNDGYIKIRAFPKMNLINSIKIYENNEIKELAFSKDKRYCYCWGKGDILNLISNNEYSEFEELDFDINKFE